MTTKEESFGRVLRRLQDEKGFSQESLAEAVCLDRTTIGNIELGKKSPTLRSIVKLANVLGITLTELMRLVEEDAARH